LTLYFAAPIVIPFAGRDYPTYGRKDRGLCQGLL
jgi:hypothetical protein